MANGPVRVDPGGLRDLAGRLREGASGLGGPASSVPDAPNAGVSSGKVSGALEAILRSSAGLVSTMDESAAKIDASDGSYGSVENQETRRFGNMIAE